MKKWLTIVSLIAAFVIIAGFMSKKFTRIRPSEFFSKKGGSGNTCLMNEQYAEVTDPNAPVLSIPFDKNDYSTKHWGIVPFCAEIGNGNIHGAFDFELKPDSKVYAAADGVVEKAYKGAEEGSGEILSVTGDGFSLGYSGLKNLQVKVGDKVKRGDYIANAVLIPHGEHHVHLGLTIDGKAVCPLQYMDDEFLEAFKEMFPQADYESQTDAPCACNCESFAPSY